MEQDRGWGTAHTSVYGGYGSWRGAGLAGSEALHPKGPHERNRLAGGREEGSSDVQSAEGTTGDAASRRAVELHRRKAFVITL